MSYPLLDLYAVMQNIPQIMGLDLTFRKDAWEGGYYMNGERHRKKDKLKVKLWRGSKGCTIFVHEQGSESISIQDWLQKYAGAKDYKDAMDMLRWSKPRPELLKYERETKEVRYVPRTDFEAIKKFELERCPLYIWMCGLFGKDRVRETWEKYNVCTDTHGNAVYWYVDRDGRILHDKRIPYAADGHRRKDRGAYRNFRVGDGYTGKCYFGEHLIKDGEETLVCESEKDALIIALVTGKTAIATGGKNQLRDVGENFVLLPDCDAKEEWESKGKVCKWWESYPHCGEHDGVGDYLLWWWKKKYGGNK